jgi:hypothetical protein
VLRRSQQQGGLRRESAAAYLLGLRVRIPPRASMWVLHVVRSLRRADHSSREALPSMVCLTKCDLETRWGEVLSPICLSSHEKQKYVARYHVICNMVLTYMMRLKNFYTHLTASSVLQSIHSFIHSFWYYSHFLQHAPNPKLKQTSYIFIRHISFKTDPKYN